MDERRLIRLTAQERAGQGLALFFIVVNHMVFLYLAGEGGYMTRSLVTTSMLMLVLAACATSRGYYEPEQQTDRSSERYQEQYVH